MYCAPQEKELAVVLPLVSGESAYYYTSSPYQNIPTVFSSLDPQKHRVVKLCGWDGNFAEVLRKRPEGAGPILDQEASLKTGCNR